MTGLKILKKSPLFDSGGGTFYVVFPKYRESEIDSYYDQAHNDYVQFATETFVVLLAMGWVAASVERRESDAV